MRRDGRFAAAALAASQKAFRLLVVDSGKGFVQSVKEAMQRVAPNVPVTVAARQPRGKFDAMIVAGSRLLDAPQWVRSFRGQRIVVPDATEGVHWAGGIDANPIHKAALAARQLAEGQAAAANAQALRLDGGGLHRGRPLCRTAGAWDPDPGRVHLPAVRRASAGATWLDAEDRAAEGRRPKADILRASYRRRGPRHESHRPPGKTSSRPRPCFAGGRTALHPARAGQHPDRRRTAGACVSRPPTWNWASPAGSRRGSSRTVPRPFRRARSPTW